MATNPYEKRKRHGGIFYPVNNTRGVCLRKTTLRKNAGVEGWRRHINKI